MCVWLATDCDSDAYGELRDLARLTLCVYVALVPIIYYILLRQAAPAILSGRANALSRSLAFFHADCAPPRVSNPRAAEEPNLLLTHSCPAPGQTSPGGTTGRS